MNEKYIVVPAEDGRLASDRYEHTVHISSDLLQRPSGVIPEGLDILGISIDFPDELREVRIQLGGYKVAVFTKEMKEDMEKFHIYLTKASYQVCMLKLVYSKEWLEAREEYEMVDEYTEEEEYGEEDVEVFDGYDYHIGRLVLGRKSVLTGNKIKHITKEVDVRFPEIKFLVGNCTHGDRVVVPVRERIELDSIDDAFKNRLLTKYNMVVSEDGKVGYVMNEIYYTHNMAGLKYCF